MILYLECYRSREYEICGISLSRERSPWRRRRREMDQDAVGCSLALCVAGSVAFVYGSASKPSDIVVYGGQRKELGGQCGDISGGTGNLPGAAQRRAGF
jgi:hypothetical protein